MHPRVPLIAGFLLVATSATSLAQARATEEAHSACAQLQSSRAEALKNRNLADLERYADAFVAQCRFVRSKIEISQAMAEVAGCRRAVGQKQEALNHAQRCIQYEYLGLGCHIQKAYALSDLGMKNEAREVISTGRSVAKRLEDTGNQMAMQAAQGGGRMKPDDIERIGREARARIAMAVEGQRWLAHAQQWLGP